MYTNVYNKAKGNRTSHCYVTDKDYRRRAEISIKQTIGFKFWN